MAEQEPSLANIKSAVQRLSGAVERLDKSVETLAGRIEPFDDERPAKGRSVAINYSQVRPTAKNIMNLIDVVAAHLHAIERDHQAIRALLENADGEYMLQSDIARYIRKPTNPS